MIHNIAIATYDDIIQLVMTKKYALYIYLGHEKTIVSDHIFVNFLYADLGTHLWSLCVYAR